MVFQSFHASAAHAAPPCYSTYGQVMADSGTKIDYTFYGQINDQAQIIGVFDSITGAVCRAYGVGKVYIDQSFNQCSYHVTVNFNGPGYSGAGGDTSQCYITYTYYTAAQSWNGSSCYYVNVHTNEAYDNGASVAWCP